MQTMPVPCRAGRRPLRHIAAVILQAAVAEFSLGRRMLPFCCMLIPNSRDMFRHAAVKIDHTYSPHTKQRDRQFKTTAGSGSLWRTRRPRMPSGVRPRPAWPVRRGSAPRVPRRPAGRARPGRPAESGDRPAVRCPVGRGHNHLSLNRKFLQHFHCRGHDIPIRITSYNYGNFHDRPSFNIFSDKKTGGELRIIESAKPPRPGFCPLGVARKRLRHLVPVGIRSVRQACPGDAHKQSGDAAEHDRWSRRFELSSHDVVS